MPRGRPRHQSPEQRRSAIFVAATEAFAEDLSTPLEAIAAKAGCSKPSLYELFASRDDLLEAVIRAEADAFRACLERARAATVGLEIAKVVEGRVTALVDHVRSRPAGARLVIGLLGDPSSPAARDFSVVLGEVHAFLAGQLGPVVAELIVGALRAMLLTLPDEPPEGDAHTIDVASRFLTGGLLAVALPTTGNAEG